MRLMCFLLCLATASSIAIASEEAHLTADWAEQYIKQNEPSLLQGSETDHVMSVYYFGRFQQRSLMGLERVKGENYEQFFTILIFEKDYLLGYYENILSFPSTITAQGEVNFPYGISGTVNHSDQLLKLNDTAFGDLCQTQAQTTECFKWQTATNSPAATKL